MCATWFHLLSLFTSSAVHGPMVGIFRGVVWSVHLCASRFLLLTSCHTFCTTAYHIHHQNGSFCETRVKQLTDFAGQSSWYTLYTKSHCWNLALHKMNVPLWNIYLWSFTHGTSCCVQKLLHQNRLRYGVNSYLAANAPHHARMKVCTVYHCLRGALLISKWAGIHAWPKLLGCWSYWLSLAELCCTVYTGGRCSVGVLASPPCSQKTYRSWRWSGWIANMVKIIFIVEAKNVVCVTNLLCSPSQSAIK